MATTASYSGADASINTIRSIAVQSRVDADIYAGMETAHQGGPTAAEAGGDGLAYMMRDEIPAGNASDRSTRTNVVYTNYNWSGATTGGSSAVLDIHGKFISGKATTTNTLLKATGGAATSQDDAQETWVYTRGGSETTKTHDAGYA